VRFPPIKWRGEKKKKGKEKGGGRSFPDLPLLYSGKKNGSAIKEEKGGGGVISLIS